MDSKDKEKKHDLRDDMYGRESVTEGGQDPLADIPGSVMKDEPLLTPGSKVPEGQNSKG